jgi:diguanylate cyclase (GGDEF)-like protein/PAS domain S-box-containing protein
MKKNLSTIWRFLLPLLLLFILAPLVLVQQQTYQHLDRVQESASEQAQTLVRLLSVTNELVGAQVESAMRLLKERSVALGEASISGTIKIAGKEVPSLFLGKMQQTNRYDLVDEVTDLVGGTATIFVKSGDDFVRIATNVRRGDRTRAVGTVLKASGKAMASLRMGQAFHGVVDILGEPYITRYEPIFDKQGIVVGAYYVGYQVDMKVLRDAVEKMRHLKTGFAVVLDDQDKIRFHSAHIQLGQAENILRQKSEDWGFANEDLPNWGFKVVVAYPLSEARSAGLAGSWFVIVGSTLLGIFLLSLIFWQLRRLVFNPIGGDPALAIDVVKRIASGNFESDDLKAPPNTLMSNVLTMRRKLRETVTMLRENSERMSLSASVFEHAHDGIFIANAEMTIIEVNPAFTVTSGYSREEALGKKPEELGFITYEESFFAQLLASGKEWRGESWSRHKNGDMYATWLDVSIVYDDEQKSIHYVGLFSDITKAQQHQKNLEHMAYHDPLTQLPNRALLSDRLKQALARAERSGEVMAVCYFDLDGFKPVNDTLGHEAGDKLLVQLATRICECLRETDTIARLGGDEFAMLLCGLQSIDECQQTLSRLLNIIKAPYHLESKTVEVSASIGYTVFPIDHSEADTLLRHADHAMYQAKVNGGSRFHLFDASHDKETRSLRQERERIEAALPNGEFRLFYQPKVDTRTGKVVGMEALIRWQHPELGLRYPLDFLPAIENTPFATPMGEWVIAEALRQIELWQDCGLSLKVSVNIAARHMMQKDFTERLLFLLRAHPNVSPNLLELEITETAAIEDVAGVAETVHNCNLLGVTFALDDFGVGYSSLTYLRRLPVAAIKIDQSFVRDMLVDPDDLAVVSGLISLSRDFKRDVVAEGVETAAHGVQLLKMGCRLVQGYGIAKPMPADSVLAWVASYKQEASWTKGVI